MPAPRQFHAPTGDGEVLADPGFDAVPTLGQAVRWLADLGGYTGPWNGPPGATVIGRGLRDVVAAARAIRNLNKKR